MMAVTTGNSSIVPAAEAPRVALGRRGFTKGNR